MLDLRGIEDRKIRPVRTCRPPAASLRRQLLGMAEHLYADYPVPGFLLTACLREEVPFGELCGTYRQWIVTIGQGGSFAQEAKPFLTGREAHLFLSAPAANRIHENVWWAKLTAAGVDDRAAGALIDRIFAYFRFDGADRRLTDTLWFFARFTGEMDRDAFGDLTDCIAWKLRHDPKFCMKGRTPGSVAKLAIEWHREMREAKCDRIIEWPGLQISDWEAESHERIWRMVELRTNRDLLYEGRKQRHCVFTYFERCAAGSTAIFSLRWRPVTDEIEAAELSEGHALTLEVNRERTVVQIRGNCNRPATAEERQIVKRWASEKGFRIGD